MILRGNQVDGRCKRERRKKDFANDVNTVLMQEILKTNKIKSVSYSCKTNNIFKYKFV